MFKNRALKVSMVKNDTPDNTARAELAEEHFLDRIFVIKESTKEIIKAGAKAVVVYVAIDTVRQVMIENAKK